MLSEAINITFPESTTCRYEPLPVKLLSPKLRLAALASACALLGGATGFLTLPHIAPPALSANTAPVSIELPNVPSSEELLASFHYLQQRGIYYTAPQTDAQAAQAEQEKPKPVWHLRGVVGTGTEYYAVVEVEGRSAWYKAGQTLPGGELVKVVLADRVTVLEEDKPVEIRLYNR